MEFKVISSVIQQVTKVGEGAYGEAFMSRNIIVKIVPIEGENEVNGSPQIRADEVLGEVIIGKMLSNLREGHRTDTDISTDFRILTQNVSRVLLMYRI